MDTFTYLTTNHNPKFSPLFASLFAESNSVVLENILNSYYSPEGVAEEMERGDCESAIINLVSTLESDLSELYLVDPHTGELLHQIPLTPENLSKTLDTLIPGGVHYYQEVEVC